MNNSDMPAAPIIYDNGVYVQSGMPAIGLTKREYFAGLAMNSLILVSTDIRDTECALNAIDYADALLKALETSHE
jgi:hypothetical protein